jgi:hypothetical protein
LVQADLRDDDRPLGMAAPRSVEGTRSSAAILRCSLGDRANHTAKTFGREITQWYRDTGAIAFRTQLCSTSGHTVPPLRLRAQERSAMIASGSVGL